jgi:glycine cleavage system aminomethyltransferase T
MQHLFAWTEPLPELANETAEIRLPILRDQDRATYFRQRFDGFGIGSYAHDPLPIDASNLFNHPAGHAYAEMPSWPEEHFVRALRSTRELLPPVGRVAIAERLNGVFSFTPDGLPLIGETEQVRGLWVAVAVWITHAGGAGRLVAELMTGRTPFVDPREVDCNRFRPFARTAAYVRTRGEQQYREVYDAIHPLQPIAVPRGLSRTPAHAHLDDLGAVWIEGAGWERPAWLETNERLQAPQPKPARDAWGCRHWSAVIGKEHRATRESVGLFDLTPFTKLEVYGPGALVFLDKIAASRIDRPPGRIVYSLLLDQSAGVVCDLTMTRLADDHFWLVLGSGTGSVDFAWLRLLLSDEDDVAVADRTSAEFCYGVWGPRSRELVSRVTTADLSTEAFPYMHAHEIEIGYAPVRAFRISYVGELGWELYGATELGPYVWSLLWQAGQDLGVAAVGTGAFDSLRLEKGYRVTGTDLRREWTPDEAGLSFAVAVDKGDFIGRDALLRRRGEGARCRLSCLRLEDRDAAPLGGEPVLFSNDVVGYVTSANFAYTIGESLAYAYLPTPLADRGTTVEIEVRGRLVQATVRNEPAFDPGGQRLRT